MPTLARRSPVRPTTAPRVASEVAPPRVSVAAVRHGKPSKQRITRARLAVFTRDDWTCQVCGRHIPPTRDNERSGEFAPMDRNDYLELDHIVPRSAGGLFVIDNLRAVCSPCNSRKSADTAFAGFPERIARAIDILQRRTPNAETARAAIEALMGEPV